MGDSWQQIPGFDHMFVDFFDDLYGCGITGTGGAYVTEDGGQSWDSVGHTRFATGSFSRVIEVKDNLRAHAICVGDVIRTWDRGRTWEILRTGLTWNDIDFSDTLHGIAVGDYGLLHTSYGGQPDPNTWYRKDLPISNAYTCALFGSDTVLLFTLRGYLFTSTDLGSTWSDTLLTSNESAGWLASCKTPRGSVYVCGTEGILMSSDVGKTWVKQISATDDSYVDIEFLNDSIGFATTRSEKVYRTTNGGKSSVPRNPTTSQLICEVRLPTHGESYCTFIFTLAVPQAVLLEVYSIDGRLIKRVLDNELRPAGLNTIGCDIRDLPAGTYVYRLILDEEQYSSRFAIVR